MTRHVSTTTLLNSVKKYPLSNQMIGYNPTHCKYAGDDNMRTAKHQNQAEIDHSKDFARGGVGGLLAEEVQFSNFAKKIKEVKYCQGANSRLCGNFAQLYMHLKSLEIVNKHGNSYKVCGKLAYSKCSIFEFYLVFMANIVQAAGRTCFFDCHNDDCFCFGTCRCRTLKNQKKILELSLTF